MSRLTPIRLDDGTIIYLEATEDVEAPSVSTKDFVDEDEEEVLTDYGMSPAELHKAAVQNFKVIEATIRAYTSYTLNAFKTMTFANVDKVTLEFGIKVGGEAGVPYVTKGTAESNLKITVECSFPEKVQQKPETE